MKAITLYQPHAYLIGVGAKPFETRPRRTHIRGLIAIHAATLWTDELDGIVGDPDAPEPTYQSPFDRYLPASWNDYFGEMNHGGIECLAVLRDCYTTEDAKVALEHQIAALSGEKRTMAQEALAFGNFGPGRFAYALTCRLHVAGNIGGVIRGYQGWWNLPAALEQELLDAYRATTGGMICRICGCTEEDACQPACSWAEDFFCTACVKGVKP